MKKKEITNLANPKCLRCLNLILSSSKIDCGDKDLSKL